MKKMKKHVVKRAFAETVLFVFFTLYLVISKTSRRMDGEYFNFYQFS